MKECLWKGIECVNKFSQCHHSYNQFHALYFMKTPMLRVREIITSQNSRPDLDQVVTI